MIILGINFGHNSSVCIIKDSKIIAAVEEEKVSRIKNDFFWPTNAINRLFKEYNLHYSDVDCISIQNDTISLIGRYNIKYRIHTSKFYLYYDFFNRVTSYFGLSKRTVFFSKESFEDEIKQLGFKNAKFNYFDHHLSHAASAFYTSPFISDLVITSDGFGGTDSFNFYIPSKNGLKLVKQNKFNVSVGQFYSMITVLLGFKPNRHEGKITGLAAFGKETVLIKKFRKLWKYNKNNCLERFPTESDNITMFYNKLSLRKKINIKQAGNDILNQYTLNNFVLLEWLKIETKGFSKEDISYACQKISEEITLNEIVNVYNRNLKNKYKKIKLSLAGGVFANVRINQLIYELDFVENIFIHPAMSDAGLAMGNAILSDLNNNGLDKSINNYKISNTYFGPNYTKDLNTFIKVFNDNRIDFYKMSNPAKEIAKLLYSNKIVGFWSKRLEWGPRALGARTILLNTFDKSVNKSLNDRLNRTEFMPFAPVVLDFKAKEYFPNYNEKIPAADYMTITYDTEKKYHQMLQAVVHIDGTARPQVIRKDINEYYYNILKEFYDLSGCAALVNTSFNAHEEPILSDPYTGINALKNNRVDFLVMDDYLFKLKINKI